MQKFVSREKLGKRAKRELDREQRQTWAISPISRKSKNMKAYDRKKARYHSDNDGIGLNYISGGWFIKRYSILLVITIFAEAWGQSPILCKLESRVK